MTKHKDTRSMLPMADDVVAGLLRGLGLAPGCRLMVVSPDASAEDIRKEMTSATPPPAVTPREEEKPEADPRHILIGGQKIRFLGAHIDADVLDAVQDEADWLDALAKERGERFTFRMAYTEAFREWAAKRRKCRTRG